MVTKSVFQNRLLPLDHVALGRFITDLEYPNRRYHDPFPNQTLPSSVSSQQDFQELVRRNRATNVGPRLTELVTLFRKAQKDAGARVSAPLATRCELHQWDQLFREACAKDDTRKWLEAAIEEGLEVYFIVGFRTLKDPKMAELAASATSHSVDLQLPLSTVVAANVPGLMLGGALDPGVSGSHTNAVKSVRSFGVVGEAVYATEYCKVRFKWYSSNKISTSSLGETRWKIHWGVRAGLDEAQDDVVEAEIDEEAEEGVDIF